MSVIIPYSNSQSLNDRAKKFKVMLDGLGDLFSSTMLKQKYKPLENELLSKPLENELPNYDSQFKPLENQFWDYGKLHNINITFMVKEVHHILFLLFVFLFFFLVLLLFFAFLLGKFTVKYELYNKNEKNKNCHYFKDEEIEAIKS